MAQLDNDQQARERQAPATGTTATITASAWASSRNGRGRALDERRREHLLSSSCSSSCSSSSRTNSDEAAATDDDDERGAERDRVGGGLSLLGRVMNGIKPGRGHHSDRFQQQQQHRSQPQPAMHSKRDGELTRPGRVGATGDGDADCRPPAAGQLSRQHSDGSAIGAQLMNVLRINDDLSSSSHANLFTSMSDSSNMLTGHPQELGARLATSSGPTTTSGAAATTMNQTPPANYEHERGFLARAGGSGGGGGHHPMPLVVVSPAPHHQHQHHLSHHHHHHHQDHLYLPPAGEHPFTGAQYGHQYPVMEPLMILPSHGSFYNSQHHHHVQQQHQQHQLGYVAAAGDEQQQLSYADLDEETARHQSERRQRPAAGNLPESVIRANEQQQVGTGHAGPRQESFFVELVQQNYSDPNLSGPMQSHAASSLRHEPAATLAALNSSVNAIDAGDHRQLGSSGIPHEPAAADRLHRQAELSIADSELGRQTRNSPADLEDELKVCEWRDCGNTFLDMNEFVRHLEEKHVNLEPREKNRFFCMWHNCKRNNQEFNARYKLLIHMRVHSGEKPYFCQNSSCKKSFSRLENLKIHVRSHTGEKPYRCQYEHCAKSFTNSSDRIKHHKTHKDPKPYNCTQDGCMKRYTDPSSLRKHLRAHKRHSFTGSMDSACESSNIATVANDHHNHSNASCSYSSMEPHGHGLQSSSTRNELHYGRHDGAQYRDQQPPYEPYADSNQLARRQQVGGSGLGHQHQEPATYLHADYDPTQEFANVLYGSSNAETELNGTMRDEITTTTSGPDEAACYFDSSFERPYQQQQQQHEQHEQAAGQTSDHFRGPSGGQSMNSAGPYCAPAQGQQHPTGQYLAPSQPIASNWDRQRPALPSRVREQTDLRDRHQQLSKSWCGSGSLRASHRQHAAPWSRAQQANQFEQQQPQMTSRESKPSIAPTRTSRVEFDCGEPSTRNYQTDEQWTEPRTVFDYHDQQQMDDVHYGNCAGQQQQHGQSWPVQTHEQAQPATGDNQQRRIHSQAHARPQQQQQLQPLTRRQQHAQLMRSMPATVNIYQSRGPPL